MAGMKKPLPPHVQVERSRHGKTVYYYRAGAGQPRVRLPAPNDKTFKAAYAAAMAGEPQRPMREASGTLAWLIARYKESSRFASLAPSTRQMRDNILQHVVKESGAVPYAAIRQRHISEGVARRKPHAGNNFRKVMSQLFAWAVKMEYVAVNPAQNADRNKISSKGFHAWTVAEVDRYLQRWPLGTREHLAICILLFTGLRRSDVYRLGRQHVTDGVISIETEKTGTWVHIPVCVPLQRAIDAAPTGDLIFLATAGGMPFRSAASFGNWFGKACRAADVPGRAHGLRKAGATIAAEAGASAHQLMAMFGWTKLEEAERYTRGADRKRSAAVAAGHIVNNFLPHHPHPVREKLQKS